ncbi:MAG: replicative DNA helicase [Clostridiales bacterium]|nr:replicative DNA helicase [Clostridiales bacterium]
MSDRDLKDNLAGVDNKPSYNVTEAEKAVLCLCMRNKDALENVVMKKMVAGDFVDPKHVAIFDAITAIYIDNKDVSRITVCDKLLTQGKTSEAGGDEYVYAVANSNAVMSALDSYVEVVIKNSQSRKLISTLVELENHAKERTASVNDIVDMAIAKLNILRSKDDNSGFENLGSILKRNLEEIKETSFGKGERKVVKTGFSYLDNITGGFKPGTVNIIAARPGMGKTALVLNIATNVAEMYGKPVAIFSLEMSKSEIANRILASKAKTDYKAIERATITREQEADLSETLGRISPLPIYIDETTNTNPMDILAKCRELMTTTPISLVVIDYLQLLTYPGRSSGSRQNEIADISRSLKVLAKELELPVIALSQLNRGTENREDGDHIPGLADIRDSGAIEQDADCVIFIHRPSYYTKKKDAGEKPKFEDAQLIVAKNRHGETDTAYVKWYGAKTLFFEPTRKDDPKDPQESAYTRTTNKESSASDYSFNEEDMPVQIDDPMPDDTDDPGEMDNSDNEAFFSDDVHDGLPEEF